MNNINKSKLRHLSFYGDGLGVFMAMGCKERLGNISLRKEG